MYRLVVLNLVILLATTITICQGKFPKSPKPCPYGDEECIKKIVNFLLSEKINGYAPLNVVSLNPLKINEISINQGKESPVNIDLRFQNSELTGIKDAKVLHVKGFGKEINGVHEITLGTDSVTLFGDYTIKGKVLILPVSGNGKSNITMDNLRLKVSILAESLVKDGETYMNVKNVKLQIETSRLHFDFRNLFNGDKVLGDNMNLFLNENWKEIFGEVRNSITAAFASIFQSVIANVFSKYPYSKLFATE
ncbi:protein takeout-like [Episyrphus balteatus]|uniref:protein takeout-like n=1 Tax=Episyrphus balteatus TaxID=286459 RepID=UPI0024867A08|nr:protein takeout-like [Episyrphus balteatus]